MRILLIETCTERGVIAYGNAREIIFSRELPFGSSQSKYIVPYLAEELKALISPQIDCIGVGIGPGSYTGIRLGVAVAQGLAYAWKIPLVGISSLMGFVPSVSSTASAAIVDARIGGVYLLKKREDGDFGEEKPQVVSIEDVGECLKEIPYLVTPYAKTLQGKLKDYYPEKQWIWEERVPSVPHVLAQVEKDFVEGKTVCSPLPLELLYLRQTEAERQKDRKDR